MHTAPLAARTQGCNLGFYWWQVLGSNQRRHPMGLSCQAAVMRPDLRLCFRRADFSGHSPPPAEPTWRGGPGDVGAAAMAAGKARVLTRGRDCDPRRVDHIVRRVKDLSRQAARRRDELFTAWRYHAVVTDSPFVLRNSTATTPIVEGVFDACLAEETNVAESCERCRCDRVNVCRTTRHLQGARPDANRTFGKVPAARGYRFRVEDIDVGQRTSHGHVARGVVQAFDWPWSIG